MAAGLIKPEKLCFLSIWGLARESVKVLLSHAKLFAALTITLIVPVYAVHPLITDRIASRIGWDQFQSASGHPSLDTGKQFGEDLQEQFTNLLVVIAFNFLSFLSLFALSFPSTAAVVYSVACIYSEKITSYKTVLGVVPRVWKRLILTCLWARLIMVGYVVVCLVLLGLAVGAVALTLIFLNNYPVINTVSTGIVVVVVWGSGAVGIAVGTIYLSCVGRLASVVTVLEKGSYGVSAISKSLNLMKGKRLAAFGLFFVYSLAAFLVGWGFQEWDVQHNSREWRAILGCALVLSLSFVELMGLLVQTVLYFACRAHHHEGIDKLEQLGTEYVPLGASI